MEPRLLALGKLVLDGEEMSFVEDQTAFDIGPRDRAELIVLFDYHEPTHDKDEVRIHLTAEIEGQKIGEARHEIGDNPIVSDDARGYVSLPVRVAGSGTLRGKFRAEALYTRERWDGDDHREARFVKEGAFEIRVK